ncbi:MAG: hypothetical protein J7452_03265, partial [Thermoflexus sp.]|nr:hypothetical protein [Thermoflexus sp.]
QGFGVIGVVFTFTLASSKAERKFGVKDLPTKTVFCRSGFGRELYVIQGGVSRRKIEALPRRSFRGTSLAFERAQRLHLRAQFSDMPLRASHPALAAPRILQGGPLLGEGVEESLLAEIRLIEANGP